MTRNYTPNDIADLERAGYGVEEIAKQTGYREETIEFMLCQHQQGRIRRGQFRFRKPHHKREQYETERKKDEREQEQERQKLLAQPWQRTIDEKMIEIFRLKE